MKKHAYLIMAHGNWEILRTLLRLLDDPRNDIFLHIDAKAKSFRREMVEGLITKGTLTLIPRKKVAWGGYSQVQVEMHLLQQAAKTEHAYYHLLSGVDMPLKTQDDIHRFFAENEGKEFISIDERVQAGTLTAERVRYYYLFQNLIGRNKGRHIAVLDRLQFASLKLQGLLGIVRTKTCGLTLYKGANWFSITHEMAQYVLAAEKTIRRIFRWGLCVDEMFLQTIAMNSPFNRRIVESSLRHIDWSRGDPYIFRQEDYSELLASEDLFARKFDSRYLGIVEELCAYLQAKTN